MFKTLIAAVLYVLAVLAHGLANISHALEMTLMAGVNSLTPTGPSQKELRDADDELRMIFKQYPVRNQEAGQGMLVGLIFMGLIIYIGLAVFLGSFNPNDWAIIK
jgi:hypothetical protein